MPEAPAPGCRFICILRASRIHLYLTVSIKNKRFYLASIVLEVIGLIGPMKES